MLQINTGSREEGARQAEPYTRLVDEEREAKRAKLLADTALHVENLCRRIRLKQITDEELKEDPDYKRLFVKFHYFIHSLMGGVIFGCRVFAYFYLKMAIYS